MSFGTNLIALREATNLSRKELAEKLNIPYTTLRNYETDQREPGHKLLIRLASIFSVSVDELIGLPATNKTAPAISAEAMKIAKDYDNLDNWGQQTVRSVADSELARMQGEKEKEEADRIAHLPKTKIIPLFGNSFAAGPGEPDFGNAYENYEVPYDTVADFAVPVHGDSMEPYLHDGTVALGIKGTPQDGDVAALVVDGEFYVKQVCVDNMGNLYMFSLNRTRKDMDKTVWSSAESSVTCFGTILMDQRIPLPLD